MGSSADVTALVQYIQDVLCLGSSAKIAADTPLISSGLLDSFSVAELVHHVEERCGVRVTPAWRTREHWDTAARIAHTVEALREGGTAGPG